LNSQWDLLFGEDLQVHHGGQVRISVCVNFYVIRTMCFLTLHTVTNKMYKLKYNKTDHKTLFMLSTKCYLLWHLEM
jgi:hypothetical protein